MQAFCPRIDMLKENRCILKLWGAPFRQKLKLKQKVFYKKISPKLIFLNDFFFFFEKILLIFDIEN